LITGTESTGKTTLTNLLSKTFSTSCAYEEGRYYSLYHLGGNNLVYQSEDFLNICWEQRKWDQIALERANKICIFDTDAVVTQFYCEMYLGKQNPRIEAMIDANRYDYIFMLKPDVE
jgi:HTH-type transcriptional repressor of NAD biosynthesis genes